MYFPLHGDIWNLPPVATPRLPFIWNVSCYFVCIFNNFNDVKPARKETEQEKNKTIQLDFLGDYFFFQLLILKKQFTKQKSFKLLNLGLGEKTVESSIAILYTIYCCIKYTEATMQWQ